MNKIQKISKELSQHIALASDCNKSIKSLTSANEAIEDALETKLPDHLVVSAERSLVRNLAVMALLRAKM